MRVVLCQRKNGLPASLALFMKSIESLTSTSSKVVMSYLASPNTFAFSAIGGTSGIGSWRQRSFVHDLLLADGAPARLDRRIVGVACPAMDEVPRADRVTDRRVSRIGVPVGIRHGVEVIQIAEELIEAVDAREVLVQVAEMVLAELSGGVAHRLSAPWRWSVLAPASRHRRQPDRPWSFRCGSAARR